MWKDFPDARAIYYVDGKPAPVGTRLKNPAYSAILSDIAARGPDAFISGANAKATSAAVANTPSNAAELTVQDVAHSQAQERPTVGPRNRVTKVCGMGPPPYGTTTLYGR